MEVSNPSSQERSLLSLPNGVLEKVVGQLPFRDARCLGEACWDTRSLFWHFVAVDALDTVPSDILKGREISLEDIPPRCVSATFVCNILQAGGSLKETIQHLIEIESPLLQNKDFILKIIPKIPKTDIFSVGIILDMLNDHNPSLLSDTQVLEALIKDISLGKIVQALCEIPSPVLQNKDFILSLIPKTNIFSVGIILDMLKDHNPALLSDTQVLEALIDISSRHTVQTLSEVSSAVLQNKDFILHLISKANIFCVVIIPDVLKDHSPELLSDTQVLEALIDTSRGQTIQTLSEVSSPVL